MLKVSLFAGETEYGQTVFPLFTRNDTAFEKAASATLLPDVVRYIDSLRPNRDSQYVLVNAMGAGEYFGSNINGDYFTETSLIHRPDNWTGNPLIDKVRSKDWAYGYPTFYYAHPFAHHRNKDASRAFGEVELAVWHDRMKRVELVCRVDKKKCEEFGGVPVWDKLQNGQFPDVSMGCKVPFDTCSICLDWKMYREAMATFQPGKHKSPGEAILHWHKNKHKIRGLSITRADYCEHAKKSMNKILPDGRKVFVYNDFPKFFDISFVFIGADKTAKTIMKIAGVGVGGFWDIGGSAELAEKLGYAEEGEKTAFKLEGHTTHQGLPIAIENQKGSVRKGVAKDGTPWRTEMKHPYGYIEGTKGKDGEEVDAYVGPKKDAPVAFVVHQHKENGKGHDEDKVMLGFKDEAAARAGFLAHYDAAGKKMLGPISPVPMEKLKALIDSKKKLEKISASVLRRISEIVPYDHGGGSKGYRLLVGGEEVGSSVFKRTGLPQIQGMEITDPNFKGVGLGKKFYGEMLRRMPGQTMASDHGVSREARVVWRGMEHRPGYALHERVGAESGPHFKASLPPAAALKPDYDLAELPRAIPNTPEEKNLLAGLRQNDSDSLNYGHSFIFRGKIPAPSPIEAQRANNIGLRRQLGLEKEAELIEEELKLAFLGKDAKSKRSEITKDIIPSQFAGKAIPALTAAEEDLPNRLLDLMGKAPLEKSLSTSGGLGMVLRPREFQRIVLINIGKKDLADEYDEDGTIFPETDEKSPMDLGPEHFLGPLAKLLMPLFSHRSALAPAIEKRVIVISGSAPPKEKRGSSSHTTELLRKIGAAYNSYRGQLMDLAAHSQNLIADTAYPFEAELRKLSSADPEEIFSPLSVEYIKSAFLNEVGPRRENGQNKLAMCAGVERGFPSRNT